jgi:hypothetical protein
LPLFLFAVDIAVFCFCCFCCSYCCTAAFAAFAAATAALLLVGVSYRADEFALLLPGGLSNLWVCFTLSRGRTAKEQVNFSVSVFSFDERTLASSLTNCIIASVRTDLS